MNTTLQRRLVSIRTFAGTQRGRVTLGISALALVSVVVVAILLPLSSPSLRTGGAPDGLNYSGPGRGRLWPLLSGERGIYAVVTGQSAEPYLDALMAARNSSGFIPEQIWDVKAPEGTQPGTPTRSMTPLNWSLAEYVVLLVSASQGRIADIPSIVQARYAA